MSIADDLQKLNELKASGALSEEEFQQAKAKLLAGPAAPSEPREVIDPQALRQLSEAADRYVSYKTGSGWVGAVMGVIIFIIMLMVMSSMCSHQPSFGPAGFPMR